MPEDRQRKDRWAIDLRFFFYGIRSSATLIIYDAPVAPSPCHFIPLSFALTRGRFLPRVLEVLAVRG